MTNAAPGFIKHPGHKLEIHHHDGPVEIRVGETVIALSKNAMRLKEATYPDVFYVPLSDLPANMLRASGHTSYCPFKGEASYFHLEVEGNTHENAIWYYRNPYDEALPIKELASIYSNVASIEPVK
ncbi:MAG: DUF427 domain-containing protein [Pseudomonadota bacterium]